MPFITLSQAKAHCRIVGDDEDAAVTLNIVAAERMALEYLQCDVYADQEGLDAAIASVPALLASAKAAYDSACVAALDIVDAELSSIERAQAQSIYRRAVYAAARTRQGIVMNEMIAAAMLLTVGWLYETREDSAEPPTVAMDLLSAFRYYA